MKKQKDNNLMLYGEIISGPITVNTGILWKDERLPLVFQFTDNERIVFSLVDDGKVDVQIEGNFTDCAQLFIAYIKELLGEKK